MGRMPETWWDFGGVEVRCGCDDGVQPCCPVCYLAWLLLLPASTKSETIECRRHKALIRSMSDGVLWSDILEAAQSDWCRHRVVWWMHVSRSSGRLEVGCRIARATQST